MAFSHGLPLYCFLLVAYMHSLLRLRGDENSLWMPNYSANPFARARGESLCITSIGRTSQFSRTSWARKRPSLMWPIRAVS
jgi:hypothetical protein